MIVGGAAGAVLASAVAWALPAVDPADLALPLSSLLLAELAIVLRGPAAQGQWSLDAGIAWLIDPLRGAARLLAIATATALFFWIALGVQTTLASQFRHTGLVFAACSVGLLVVAAACVFVTPGLLRVWSLLARAMGNPSPGAALLVVAAAAGGAAAWTGFGHGPKAMAPIGLVALILAVQAGVATRLSLRRR